MSASMVGPATVTELLNTVTASDALTKFNTEQFVEKLDARPDQYDAGMYVMRLAGILDKYRLTDDHVIYVGVTGADLFAGDTGDVILAEVGVGAGLGRHWCR